ncbi:hypothetical protein [Lentibacillus persicus]|nr:hypothetical protein [Lentibacillus persicus]
MPGKIILLLKLNEATETSPLEFQRGYFAAKKKPWLDKPGLL